ncbi:unnamed protein product [Cuscuta campestris]|uniref:O-methyltransferase C-terminal domain-containing protein n=1 Tax=Cuscuta campestris TaxID=132261 RepID=A0A484KVT1_9ASTE|nr:unnamed protein product [Cuscuta campestris]
MNKYGLSYDAYVLQHHPEELMRACPLVCEAEADSMCTPFTKANCGITAHAHYGRNPEMKAMMQRAMFGVSVPFMKSFLEGYDGFRGVKRLVDVGGSAGDCLRMIIERHPTIQHVVNFDLEEVVQKAPHIPKKRERSKENRQRTRMVPPLMSSVVSVLDLSKPIIAANEVNHRRPYKDLLSSPPLLTLVHLHHQMAIFLSHHARKNKSLIVTVAAKIRTLG